MSAVSNVMVLLKEPSPLQSRLMPNKSVAAAVMSKPTDSRECLILSGWRQGFPSGRVQPSGHNTQRKVKQRLPGTARSISYMRGNSDCHTSSIA